MKRLYRLVANKDLDFVNESFLYDIDEDYTGWTNCGWEDDPE